MDAIRRALRPGPRTRKPKKGPSRKGSSKSASTKMVPPKRPSPARLPRAGGYSGMSSLSSHYAGTSSLGSDDSGDDSTGSVPTSDLPTSAPPGSSSPGSPPPGKASPGNKASPTKKSSCSVPFRAGIQLSQLFVIAVFLSLSIPRLLIPNGPYWLYSAISFFTCGESLVLLVHELLTENVCALQGRGSRSLYFISNIRGAAMWTGAAFLTHKGNLNTWGTNQILGILSLCMAAIIGCFHICIALFYLGKDTTKQDPDIPLDSMQDNTESEPSAVPVSKPPSYRPRVISQSDGTIYPNDSITSVGSLGSNIPDDWRRWSNAFNGDRELNDNQTMREYQLDIQSSRV